MVGRAAEGGLLVDQRPPGNRGFDFPGYHLTPAGLTVASATVERFTARVTRLYERRPRLLG